MKKTTSTLFLTLLLTLASGLAADESWVDSLVARQFFAVSVEDVDRSIAWYTTALGLEVLDDTTDPGGVWRIANLSREGLSVELIFDRRAGAKPEGRVRGVVKVGFAVPNVHLVADRVEKATGERPRVVDFATHSIHILQLQDPDGNLLQLTSPLGEPSATLDGPSNPSTSSPDGKPNRDAPTELPLKASRRS